ncbi:MAG: ribonuclease III [Oscillospiraceae bacterium]|nr:ribonuclease III [Oscillospiraceae bacterium]
MKQLQEKIDYRFKNEALLKTALTHSSYANEHSLGHSACNERLEFLGDSVLGFVVAEFLYSEFPEMTEGEMTRFRAELVCESSLAAAAEQFCLGEHILLGKGEKNSGGSTRPSIISDAFEAVLAAIYLDGGEKYARRHIEKYILNKIGRAAGGVNHDYKTMLQELIQGRGADTPTYRITAESGPDHDKSFVAQVLYGGKVAGEGSGKSKKEAEQAAAKAAFIAEKGTP